MSNQANDAKARPQPHVITPSEAALEAIAHTRETAVLAHDATHKLLELARLADKPAELRIIRIPDAAGNNPINDRHRNAYKSLGVWVPAAGAAGGALNPNGAGVYVGVAGSSGRPGSGAPFVAAGSAVVLPLSDIDVELGADPAVLLTSFVFAYVFFFDTTQPFFLR